MDPWNLEAQPITSQCSLEVVTDDSNSGDDDAVVVKLIRWQRCGAIECVRPVWSIGIYSSNL